jgi:hypothetical protein
MCMKIHRPTGVNNMGALHRVRSAVGFNGHAYSMYSKPVLTRLSGCSSDLLNCGVTLASWVEGKESPADSPRRRPKRRLE